MHDRFDGRSTKITDLQCVERLVRCHLEETCGARDETCGARDDGSQDVASKEGLSNDGWQRDRALMRRDCSVLEEFCSGSVSEDAPSPKMHDRSDGRSTKILTCSVWKGWCDVILKRRAEQEM